MANPEKRLSENAHGDFFVDSTCIDCDTCRRLASAVYAEGGGHAFVHRQPATDADRRHALRALVCCPTGSIGTLGDDCPAEAMDDPESLDEWRKHLAACGIEIEHEQDWPRGGHSLYFRDPAGNAVEFITPGVWGTPVGW